MRNPKELMLITIDSVKRNGVIETGKKIERKIVRKLLYRDYFLKQLTGKRILWDVLFVNGCDPIAAPHPYRYRVLHQIEQLQAAGYSAVEVYYTDCTPFTVLDARIIVFYRCPYTEYIGGAIKLAKELNKRVLFDVDDLVIDNKYTDLIPQVQQMNRRDRALYDEGVVRMGATLKMCEAATTTTRGLQRELQNYVPTVFINRNSASEQMMKISEEVCRKKEIEEKTETEEEKDIVKLGYFSGSLTHNADFELIKPAVKKVLDENENVRLLLMGEIDLPEDMKPYEKKILRRPFCDWKKLPEAIASVDINLAPIENTVFNEAKSENKWVEAALVKVATIASDVGAFAEVIDDNRTGFLCGDDAWYDTMSKVIHDAALRNRVAKNAYDYCRKEYLSLNRASTLRAFYDSIAAKHIAFVLPSCEISGGIMVALYHASFLQDNGWDVDIIAPVAKNIIWEIFGHKFSCISREDGITENREHYDVMVATMWSTVDYVRNYPNVKKRCYLVQNYETDFYDYNMRDRLEADATYCIHDSLIYLTISKWCEKWLRENYGQEVLRVRNGIRLDLFEPRKREISTDRIRILIEGDCAVDYKNIDESFAIVDKLDRKVFEVWYMSYNAKPKAKYHYDKFLHAVPYEKVGKVYEQCDILLKSSYLESFSYPPLEMMATGGFCVVAPNGGNAEYLVDGENCLLYEPGNLDSAVEAIHRICRDNRLRETLYKNGMETAKSRSWDLIRDEVVKMYEGIAE